MLPSSPTIFKFFMPPTLQFYQYLFYNYYFSAEYDWGTSHYVLIIREVYYVQENVICGAYIRAYTGIHRWADRWGDPLTYTPSQLGENHAHPNFCPENDIKGQ